MENVGAYLTAWVRNADQMAVVEVVVSVRPISRALHRVNVYRPVCPNVKVKNADLTVAVASAELVRPTISAIHKDNAFVCRTAGIRSAALMDAAGLAVNVSRSKSAQQAENVNTKPHFAGMATAGHLSVKIVSPVPRIAENVAATVYANPNMPNPATLVPKTAVCAAETTFVSLLLGRLVKPVPKTVASVRQNAEMACAKKTKERIAETARSIAVSARPNAGTTSAIQTRIASPAHKTAAHAKDPAV